MTRLVRFFAIICFLPAAVRAEMYECDGKWTNKPCSGAVTRSIEEAGSNAPVDANIKGIREKTSILHELRMRTIQARQRYDLRVEIADVEDLCLKQPSSADECREKVSAQLLELDQRLAAVSAVEAQERSIALQEEANRLQEERNAIEANKPNIAIVEEERPIIVGADGFGGRPPVIVVPDRPRHDHGVVVYDNHGNPKKLEGVKPGPFAPKKELHDDDHHRKCR